MSRPRYDDLRPWLGSEAYERVECTEISLLISQTGFKVSGSDGARSGWMRVGSRKANYLRGEMRPATCAKDNANKTRLRCRVTLLSEYGIKSDPVSARTFKFFM